MSGEIPKPSPALHTTDTPGVPAGQDHDAVSGELVLPLSFTRAEGPHGHWAITDATGTIHACPHQEPTEALWQLLHQATGLLEQPTPVSEPQDTPTDAPDAPAPEQEPAAGDTPVIERDGVLDTQALRFYPPAAEAMERAGINEQTVREILADENTYRRPGRNGAVEFYARHLKIVVGDDHTVLVVRDQAPWRPSGGSQPQVSGTKADRRTPLPRDINGYLDLLRRRGFTIEPGGKHQILRHEQHPGKTLAFPSSLSDSQRGLLNHAAEIRRVFGITLTDDQG